MDEPAAEPKLRSRLLQAVLALVLIAFVAYKLLLPWTPLWVDLIFIVVGVVVILALPKTPPKEEPR